MSYVVTVLRQLMCGERKFSSHDLVNELDINGDHIADTAEIESRAPRARVEDRLVRESWRW